MNELVTEELVEDLVPEAVEEVTKKNDILTGIMLGTSAIGVTAIVAGTTFGAIKLVEFFKKKKAEKANEVVEAVEELEE